MRRVLLALFVLLAAAGCGGTGSESLADVARLSDFAQRFDDAAGRPRLVLLLSAT